MFKNIIPIILCGGAGTRLWPLSRRSFPKQFVPLIGNKSLLQLTLERVAQLGGQEATKAICVASEDHRFFVTEALQNAKVGGRIILEPVARNTTAAMALATLCVQEDDLLVFCPSDHHIPDVEAFCAVVGEGIAAANSGAIVTFGVMPTFPSTAYGYIKRGPIRADGTQQVLGFIEKPNWNDAQALILQGGVLWNSGIFMCKAKTLIHAFRNQTPDILASCQKALALGEIEQYDAYDFIRPDAKAFNDCRAQSIDYAIMERHTNIAVVPFNETWSDVGSWSAVADLIEPDVNGNSVYGQGTAIEASHTFIHAPHRLVVALGTQNLLIIDTPDALLVAARSHAEQVKHVVSELEARHSPQADKHRKVARPWGWYDSIDVGDRFQVKRILVKPGASLSLQKHHHRAEHWIVVKGTAKVTRESDTFLLHHNQSTYITIGETHSLHNPGQTDLEIIAVQSDSLLGEDDLVRLEDACGRV